MRIISLSLLGLTLMVTAASAESVLVKYRGPVDLTPFDCEDVTRSSFIRRVCYDATNQYMIIKLKRTYYHYCEIGVETVAALKAAESMGRYYNANIKGWGATGRLIAGRIRFLPTNQTFTAPGPARPNSNSHLFLNFSDMEADCFQGGNFPVLIGDAVPSGECRMAQF